MVEVSHSLPDTKSSLQSNRQSSRVEIKNKKKNSVLLESN